MIPPKLQKAPQLHKPLMKDSTLNFTLNASDIENDTITWSILTDGSHGNASVSGTGTSNSISYTPDANYNGSDSFVVQIDDGNSGTDTITVNVTINNVNDPPVITEGATISQTVNEDNTLNFTLNATDIENDTITWSISTDGGNGTASASGNGTSQTISYTPDANYNGTDSFEVQIDDSNGGTDSIVVNVTISPTNDSPQVVNAIPNQTATEDTALNFTFAANTFNDIDAGDSIHYSAQLNGGSPLPAWLSFEAATRTFSGTPTNDDVGTIEVEVIASDTSNASTTDQFQIVVTNTNDPPTLANAIPDQQAVEDSEFIFTFADNTFNDIDLGDSLRYSAQLNGGASLPSWLTLNSQTRTFSGTPLNEDVGTLNIDVTATDNSNATVTDTFQITVSNTNDAPIVTNPIPNIETNEDELFANTFPENTFVDIDTGDTLSYTAQRNGSSTLPSWLSFNARNRTFSGTPENQDVGSVEIEVIATDTNSASSTDVFQITVINVNDPPIISLSNTTTYFAINGGPIVIDTQAHFEDIDVGDFDTGVLSVSITQNGSLDDRLSIHHEGIQSGEIGYTMGNPGIVTYEGIPIGEAIGGDQAMTNPLQITFNANSNQSCIDALLKQITFDITSDTTSTDIRSLQWIFTDGDGGTSNPVTKYIQPNFRPTVQDQSLTINEDTVREIQLIGNDRENAPLTFAIVNQPQRGTIRNFDSITGRLEYIPDENNYQSDSFTFKVNDGIFDSIAGTINISILPENDPPVAYTQTIELAEDSQASVQLRGKDFDGEKIVFNIKSFPKHGSISVFIFFQGTFYYTPDENYYGTDTFQFTTIDTSGLESEMATVQLIIHPVEDPPTVTNQSIITQTDTPIDIQLNAIDPDNDSLSFSIVDSPANGTIQSFNDNNGTMTYVPNTGFYGNDIFRYTVTDAHTDPVIGQVDISVLEHQIPTDTPTQTPTPENTPTVTPTSQPTIHFDYPDIVSVFDDPNSTEDLTGSIDEDDESERILDIRWNYDLLSEPFPVSEIELIYVAVDVNNTGCTYLAECPNTTDCSYTWCANAPNVCGTFSKGPESGNEYQFSLFVKLFDDTNIYHFFNSPNPVSFTVQSSHSDTPTPKPPNTDTPTPPITETPTPVVILPSDTPTPSDTPMPVSTQTPDPTDTPTVSTPIDPKPTVKQNFDSILLCWNLDHPDININEIQSTHVYVKVNGGIPYLDSNEIDDYYYLGHTDQPNSTEFEWKALNENVFRPFKNGPQPGFFYEFKIYIITVNRKVFGPYKTDEPILYTPEDPSTIPFVVSIYDNPKKVEDLTYRYDFDSVSKKELVIHWDFDRANPPLDQADIQDIHIYTQMNDGEDSFLARTGDGTINSYTWKKNSPGVNKDYRDGPQYNQKYHFIVIAITKTHNTRFYGRGPVLFKPKVIITDDSTSEIDLSNGIDYDSPDDCGLTIHWDFSEIIDDLTEVTDYHIWVKENGIMKFLANTNTGNASSLDWRKNTRFVSEEFANGPAFGTEYQFFVYAITPDKTIQDHNIGPVSVLQK
jgi:hypothetical protein